MAPSPQVVELVKRLPDPDGNRMLSSIDKKVVDDVVAELTRGGSGSIGSLADMLAVPGEADDMKPRYALHCMAVQSCTSGDGPRRSFAQAVAAQLAGDRPKPVKAFLVELLQTAGGDEVVGSLSPLLADEELCDPAARALVAIGAVDPLRQALPRVQGPNKLNVIQALGEMGDTRSSGPLQTALGDTDADVRLTAAFALANSGDSGSADALFRAAEVDSVWERDQMTNACLLLAEKLAAAGRNNDAINIYRRLLATRTKPEDSHAKVAAARGLVSAGK